MQRSPVKLWFLIGKCVRAAYKKIRKINQKRDVTIPAGIKEHLEAYHEKCISSEETIHADRIRLFEMCESPLEHTFLMTMWDYTNGYPVNFLRLHLLASNFGEPFQFGYNLRIFPQYQVTVPNPGNAGSTRNYRVDFMHFLIPPCLPHNVQLPIDFERNAIARVVVELDGHDFHERTPDQALRDRSRDRALTAAGYTVMRFTGREIYHGADARGLELISYLDKVIDEYNDAHSLRFFPE